MTTLSAIQSNRRYRLASGHGSLMSNEVQVVETGATAATFVGVLMCRRLLRALLASQAFAIVLLATVGTVLAIIELGARDRITAFCSIEAVGFQLLDWRGVGVGRNRGGRH